MPSTQSRSNTHAPSTSPVPTSAPLTIIATSEMERSPMQLPAAMMVQPTSEAGMLSTSLVEMSSSVGT